MTTLADWHDAACRALGLDEATAADAAGRQGLVLDLAREAAHGVVRPAAPLAAYLLGLAVGGGADPAAAAATLTALARDWPPPTPNS